MTKYLLFIRHFRYPTLSAFVPFREWRLRLVPEVPATGLEVEQCTPFRPEQCLTKSNILSDYMPAEGSKYCDSIVGVPVVVGHVDAGMNQLDDTRKTKN